MLVHSYTSTLYLYINMPPRPTQGPLFFLSAPHLSNVNITLKLNHTSSVPQAITQTLNAEHTLLRRKHSLLNCISKTDPYWSPPPVLPICGCLFSLSQHKFQYIPSDVLHVNYLLRSMLSLSSGTPIQSLAKGRYWGEQRVKELFV